jgi:hypothetical protein
MGTESIIGVRNTTALFLGGALLLALGGGCGEYSKAQKNACDTVLAELAMPLAYRVTETGVEVDAADGSGLHLVFGPWGAHNSPHTGHAYGNGKADMMAVFTNGEEDLLAFDGGPCVDYDEDAPNCGLPRDSVHARRPAYVLPNGFSAETLASMEKHGLAYEIRRVMVTYQGAIGEEGWNYFDSGDQWEVEAYVCGFTFTFGHLGALSPDLIAELEDRGVDYDFEAFDGPLGANLLAGKRKLTMAPGTPVAFPQLVGRFVPAGVDSPTAYAVPHRSSAVLWAQIEFGTRREDLRSGRSYNVPSYDLLGPTEHAQWESLLHMEMNDPQSARYSNVFSVEREWLWRAEGVLNQSPEYEFGGMENGLLRRLGDWWELHGGCTPGDVTCDEVIAFNRIRRESAAFDPSLYEADSRYLLWLLRAPKTPSPAGYYGEILWADGDLEADPTGSFLVRWRELDGGATIDGSSGLEAHQYVAWRLGDDDSLRLAWGESEADAEDAVPVEVPASNAACDGETLTCYTGWNEHAHIANIDVQL